MSYTDRLHVIAELDALEMAGKVSEIWHTDVIHNLEEILNKPIIIHEAYPHKSDYDGQDYAFIRVVDDIGPTVYLVGGNAASQAIGLMKLGKLPANLILKTTAVNGHSLYYWDKAGVTSE